MAKERVVIFEGEDKFIKPRNTVYDVNSGEANFIRDEPPSDTGLPPVDKIGDMPSDGGVRRTPIDLPPPSEPEPPVEQPIDKPPVDNPIDAKVPADITPPLKPVEPVFVPQVPVVPVISTLPQVPLGGNNLGSRPSSSGSGGAGGSKDVQKKPFNWLWIILIGGAAIYLLTKKDK